MTEKEMIASIRAMAQRVADARNVERDCRIGLQVAGIIVCAGGTLHPEGANILAQVYRRLQWFRDGHRGPPHAGA